MARSILIAIPLMLIFAAVQSAALTMLPLFGQVVQPVLLMAIAWSLLRGLPEGIAWGFTAGFALDLFSVGPFGATSLAIMAAITVAVMVRTLLPHSRYLLPAVVGGGCAALYLILDGLLVDLVGFNVNWSFLNELPLFIVVQSTGMLLIYWPLYWLDRLLNPEPIRSLE